MDSVQHSHILIVDDNVANNLLLEGILRTDFIVKIATDGQTALRLSATSPQPDLILLDITMPGLDGYETCRILKQSPLTQDIPVIFVSASTQNESEEEGFQVGCVDFIHKPYRADLIKLRVQNHLALSKRHKKLEEKVGKQNLELYHNQLILIDRLCKLATFKDRRLTSHLLRVAHYSRIIAESMTKNSEWSTLLFDVSGMHDIGLISVPDELRDYIYQIDYGTHPLLRQHPQIGADIIGSADKSEYSEAIQLAREVALYHHECLDGSGYPQGLKGDKIPLAGRIVAVADFFDRQSDPNNTGGAQEFNAALNAVKESSGRCFDPEVVEHLILQIEIIRQIYDSVQDGSLTQLIRS